MAKQTKKNKDKSLANETGMERFDNITLSNLKFLILAYREGMGTYTACKMTGNTPEELTSAVEADPTFKAQIESAISACNFEELKKVTELREKGKYTEAKKVGDNFNRMHSLVTWKQFGESKDLNTDAFMHAYSTVRHPKDISVGFGISHEEYVAFINNNANIVSMVDMLIEKGIL